MKDLDRKLHEALTAEETKSLIEAGADVNSRDENGKTALIRSLFKLTRLLSPEQTKVLINAGADVNAKDEDDKTALMYAKSAEQAKMLIEAGADVNAKNKNGQTALILGIKSMNSTYRLRVYRNIVKMLIEAGADVNAKDKNDKTVFDYAIESQKYLNNQLVELEKSIKIKKDRNEEPALILDLEREKEAVIHSGIQDIIKMLIEAGAHVDTKYKNGQTVSDHAVKSQNHITELTKANTMLKHSEAMKGNITPKLANELIDKMKGARE